MNVGGVEKSLLDLLHHIDYSKYEVDLLLIENKGDYFGSIPSEVNIIYCDTKPYYGAMFSVLISCLKHGDIRGGFYRIIIYLAALGGKKMLFLLRSFFGVSKRYDVAIAYRIGLCADIVAYVVKAKKKLVWWHHGTCSLNGYQIKSCNETWLKMDNVVTVSEGCKELLAHNFKYPVDAIKVIPNMIDANVICRFAGAISPYSKDQVIRIVSVGRLYIEKHFEDVVYCVRKMLDNGIHNFHWYIIGDGELRKDLEMKIIIHDVGEHLTLLGKKDNPYSWMKFADFFVHPSYVESQCLTILEAMALGIPCVVCKSIGPLSFVRDGINGILTDPNPQSLYHGVSRMLSISDKQPLINEAYKTIKQFSANSVMLLFEKLI